LKKIIEVADVPSKDRKPQLLRLQEQDTILKGTKPGIFPVTLKAT
jgi:hypothetical protein